MARNQKNFKLFDYLDDNGTHWSLRGESGGAGAAVDGNAPFDPTKPVFGRTSTRRHPRYVVYQDAVTFRTVKFVVYTPTAFAAIVPGNIVAVQVEGLATTVNYTLSAKIPEKMPVPKASRNLADT